jgi:adenosine deaminase
MLDRTPLIDIHRHLEAAPAAEDLAPLILKHGINLPRDPEELRRRLVFDRAPGDLRAFLRPFADTIPEFFVSHAAVKDFTLLAIERAHREGVSYLELRFSPDAMAGTYSNRIRLSKEAVCAAVFEARAEAAQRWSVVVGLILIIGRELEPSAGHVTVDLAVKYRKEACGIDLAGNERVYGPQLFEGVLDRARGEGFPLTIHAGEAGPAEYVRYAVERLGARRIGHGVAAAQDPEVVALLRDTGTLLEICLISNALTGAVQGPHPLMLLHRAGVKVSINTDDPMIQGTGLADEAQRARELGATEADLEAFGRNSWEARFVL